MKDEKTVCIIDDNTFIRESLIGTIDGRIDLSVCSTSIDMKKPLAAVKRLHPDIIIVNLSFSKGDPVSFIRIVRSRWPEILILAFSNRKGLFYAERALKAGADGYLPAREIPENIVSALQKILHGEIYLSEKMKSAMVNTYIRRGTSDDLSVDRLSAGEKEIFKLTGSGFGPAEIADHLGLSRKTIESSLLRIKRKLHIDNSMELEHIASLWLQVLEDE